MPPIPILLYHSLTAEATPRYRPYAVDPGRFREQMEALADAGCRTLTVGELAGLLADRESRLPPRPVLVTFDDGFEEVHRVALPILDRLGLRATAYLVTAHLGGTSRWLERDGEGDRRLLSWAQVRELAAHGVEIGGHSHRHPELDTLPPEVARDEVRRCRELLEDGLGTPVTTFAYPYGYHSPSVKRLVHEAGYSSACAVRHALSHDRDDPLALARVVVPPDAGPDRIIGWLAGRGLVRAGPGERPQTVGWRLVRRTASRLGARRVPNQGC